MHHAFYTLARHEDIEKFELEDGLVRSAGHALLAEPSSLRHVVVDVRREAPVNLGVDVRPVGFDASIRLSAEVEHDAHPANLGELVIDVGSVVGAWTVTFNELAAVSPTWRGTATPGTKLSFLLQSAPGIDRASYNRWLDDALASCLQRMAEVGVRHLGLAAGSPFDSVVEFAFTTDAALTSAARDQAFTPLVGSELLDHSATRLFASVEHRLAPNEHVWDLRDDATPKA